MPSSTPKADPAVPYKSKKHDQMLKLDPVTFQELKDTTARRNFRNRSEYLRWLIKQDAAGNLLHADKAFEKIVDHLVTGFGTGIGYIAAEMERQQVELTRKRLPK